MFGKVVDRERENVVAVSTVSIGKFLQYGQSRNNATTLTWWKTRWVSEVVLVRQAPPRTCVSAAETNRPAVGHSPRTCWPRESSGTAPRRGEACRVGRVPGAWGCFDVSRGGRQVGVVERQRWRVSARTRRLVDSSTLLLLSSSSLKLTCPTRGPRQDSPTLPNGRTQLVFPRLPPAFPLPPSLPPSSFLCLPSSFFLPVSPVSQKQ